MLRLHPTHITPSPIRRPRTGTEQAKVDKSVEHVGQEHGAAQVPDPAGLAPAASPTSAARY